MKGFLWSAHPARGLLETWALGLALLFLFSLLVGNVTHFVFGNGALLLCGTCGMWAVLRIRVPARLRALVEIALAVALSLVMAAGLQAPARLLGWDALWSQSPWGPDSVTFLMAATGPGYLGTRVIVHLWQVWDRMRRQRMLWALTHAHLTVVVLLAVLATIGLFVATPPSRPAVTPPPQAPNPLAEIATEITTRYFPASGVIVVLTLIVLAALLPPSAVFSFLVARQTTRRLEALAQAARALRSGQYAARVPVVGQDEVAQLQSDFNAMAGDLERTLRDLQEQRDTVARLLQSRRELVASVSHELRTPVATLRAIIETCLERGAPPEAVRHDLQVMQGEILRLQTLIDDLFTLARAEVDGLDIRCAPADARIIVQRIVDAQAPLAWQSGRVEVVAELPPRLPPARVDAERLEQVIANLVRNAVRHTAPGGIVAVQIQPQPDSLCIQVRDTGEGIPLQDLPHIWERFYRGANARGGDQGAGLGLAIVKDLVEAMGGHVAVESRTGQGSCFTIHLPLA